MEAKNSPEKPTEEQMATLKNVSDVIDDFMSNLKTCCNMMSSLDITLTNSLPINKKTGEELIELKNNVCELLKEKPPGAFRSMKLENPSLLSLEDIENQIKHYSESYDNLKKLKRNLIDQPSTSVPSSESEESAMSPQSPHETVWDDELVLSFAPDKIATSSPLPRQSE